MNITTEEVGTEADTVYIRATGTDRKGRAQTRTKAAAGPATPPGAGLAAHYAAARAFAAKYAPGERVNPTPTGQLDGTGYRWSTR